MRTQLSKQRIPALVALCLGAALASGCANWGESSRMGAGPSTRSSTTDSTTQVRPSSGPGTVTPSGTTGPSGTTSGAGASGSGTGTGSGSGAGGAR